MSPDAPLRQSLESLTLGKLIALATLVAGFALGSVVLVVLLLLLIL